MRRNQGQFKREHVAVRVNLMTEMEQQKTWRREVDRQAKHQTDMENPSRKSDTQKSKATATNYRICQYLLVCPAVHQMTHYVVPCLPWNKLLKSMVLSPFYIQDLEVSPVHRATQLVTLCSSYSGLCPGKSSWWRQLACFLPIRKVWYQSKVTYLVCTVPLGSRKRTDPTLPQILFSFSWSF